MTVAPISSQKFKALILSQKNGEVESEIRDLTNSELPNHQVTVQIEYSSLNYKDGLALLGKAKVVRQYPMVPGIDLAGVVVGSQSTQWKPGDRVICTGWGMGESNWGGYSQFARLKPEWLVRVPDTMSTESAMSIGTAGLTAMLAVVALEEHEEVTRSGEVLVTGAAGGVGSLAVAILSNSGYRVVASTGREPLHEYLYSLGAERVIGREHVLVEENRPLASARWSGAVDSVGGTTLASILSTLAPAASVASCGNAGGNSLSTTVLPFILRGARLVGIDSNYCPIDQRDAAWKRLASDLPHPVLQRLVQRVTLPELPGLASQILQGGVRGRIVVALK